MAHNVVVAVYAGLGHFLSNELADPLFMRGGSNNVCDFHELEIL
jgi:hypothetical protein